MNSRMKAIVLGNITEQNKHKFMYFHYTLRKERYI